jgi:hypothetical protein
MAGKPGLERRLPVDLAGDEHRSVEQKRRLTFLHDRESHLLQRSATGDWQLGRKPGKADPPAAPELGMDHDRQSGRAEHPHQPLDPRHVIPMTVAEHDHLDLGRIDREPAHVLHHPVRRHPGVEQQRSLAACRLDPHQRRESRLGDQQHHSVCHSSSAGAGMSVPLLMRVRT